MVQRKSPKQKTFSEEIIGIIGALTILLVIMVNSIYVTGSLTGFSVIGDDANIANSLSSQVIILLLFFLTLITLFKVMRNKK